MCRAGDDNTINTEEATVTIKYVRANGLGAFPAQASSPVRQGEAAFSNGARCLSETQQPTARQPFAPPASTPSEANRDVLAAPGNQGPGLLATNHEPNPATQGLNSSVVPHMETCPGQSLDSNSEQLPVRGACGPSHELASGPYDTLDRAHIVQGNLPLTHFSSQKGQEEPGSSIQALTCPSVPLMGHPARVARAVTAGSLRPQFIAVSDGSRPGLPMSGTYSYQSIPVSKHADISRTTDHQDVAMPPLATHPLLLPGEAVPGIPLHPTHAASAGDLAGSHRCVPSNDHRQLPAGSCQFRGHVHGNAHCAAASLRAASRPSLHCTPEERGAGAARVLGLPSSKRMARRQAAHARQTDVHRVGDKSSWEQWLGDASIPTASEPEHERSGKKLCSRSTTLAQDRVAADCPVACERSSSYVEEPEISMVAQLPPGVPVPTSNSETSALRMDYMHEPQGDLPEPCYPSQPAPNINDIYNMLLGSKN